MAQLSCGWVRRVLSRGDVPPLPIDLEIPGLDVPGSAGEQHAGTQTAVVDRPHVQPLIAGTPRVRGQE